MATAYSSFADFYPYYPSEHSNRTCRRLHFVGTSLVIATLLTLVVTPAMLMLGERRRDRRPARPAESAT